MSVGGGSMHCASIVVRLRKIRAVVHEELNDTLMSLDCGTHKRSPTGVVSGVRYRARLQ